MEAHADLRFLIPLERGQRVALFDSSSSLAHTLQEERMDITLFRSIAELKNETFDHVMIPVLTDHFSGEFAKQSARVLRPKGTLFVGFGNRSAIERALFWKQNSDTEPSALNFSLRRFFRILKLAKLSILNSYGIRNLAHPQYIVSLDQPAPSRFFFAQMFYPHSYTGAIAQKTTKTLALMGLQRTLFKYFGVLAQK